MCGGKRRARRAPVRMVIPASAAVASLLRNLNASEECLRSGPHDADYTANSPVESRRLRFLSPRTSQAAEKLRRLVLLYCECANDDVGRILDLGCNQEPNDSASALEEKHGLIGR